MALTAWFPSLNLLAGIGGAAASMADLFSVSMLIALVQALGGGWTAPWLEVPEK